MPPPACDAPGSHTGYRSAPGVAPNSRSSPVITGARPHGRELSVAVKPPRKGLGPAAWGLGGPMPQHHPDGTYEIRAISEERDLMPRWVMPVDRQTAKSPAARAAGAVGLGIPPRNRAKVS
jgi:hypothetical protein